MSIDFFGLAWKITFPGKPLKKLVLLSLADHYNNNVGFAWPSYETIATRCGVDRRTVIRVVAELVADGFVTREMRHKTGRLRTSNAYRLNEKLMRSAAGLTEVPKNTKQPFPGMVTQDHHSNDSTPSPLSMVTEDHHCGGDTGSPSIVTEDHHCGGDTGSPLMVTHDHYDGDTRSLLIVTDDHHHGDRRSPKRLNEPLSDPLDEPLSTTSTAPTAIGLPPDTAVADDNTAEAAAADPLTPILDWIGFDDALTAEERGTLDPALLLAWSYWVQLERMRQNSRVINPVGLVRARWRRGQQPREGLMALARGWLALDEGGRGRLLIHLENTAALGLHDPNDLIDAEFEGIPLATAQAIYEATDGELGPPALMPSKRQVKQEEKEVDGDEQKVKAGNKQSHVTSTLWKAALGELEMQMTRATFSTWLEGTKAAEIGGGLTVFVRNSFALEWLENRLRPLVQQTVDSLAGGSMPVRFAVNGDGHEAI